MKPLDLQVNGYAGTDFNRDGLTAEAGVQVQIAVRLARETVDARVRAPPVGVDRPLERNPRTRRHAVDRALRPDLVKAGVERLGRVEAPHHRGGAQAR